MRRLCGILLLLACGAAARATPYTVPLVQDAFVAEAAPDRVHGLPGQYGGALAVCGSSVLNGAGALAGRMDSFLQFSIASILPQLDADFGHGAWQIQAVTLRIEEQTNPNNPFYGRGQGTFDVYWNPDDTWAEGTLTWNNAAGYLGGPLELLADEVPSIGPQPQNQFVVHLLALELTAGFAADIPAGGPVSLYMTTQNPGLGLQFASMNNNTPSRRPYVVLEVGALVPEPASLGLLVAGLGAAMARRLRCRRGR